MFQKVLFVSACNKTELFISKKDFKNLLIGKSRFLREIVPLTV
jgi:hypothetical protein